MIDLSMWAPLHANERARAEFCDPEPTEQRTMIGAAVDRDGLEDGLRGALDELTPAQQLQVLTLSSDQRRRAVQRLVDADMLRPGDAEVARLWLATTRRCP